MARSEMGSRVPRRAPATPSHIRPPPPDISAVPITSGSCTLAERISPKRALDTVEVDANPAALLRETNATNPWASYNRAFRRFSYACGLMLLGSMGIATVREARTDVFGSVDRARGHVPRAGGAAVLRGLVSTDGLAMSELGRNTGTVISEGSGSDVRDLHEPAMVGWWRFLSCGSLPPASEWRSSCFGDGRNSWGRPCHGGARRVLVTRTAPTARPRRRWCTPVAPCLLT